MKATGCLTLYWQQAGAFKVTLERDKFYSVLTKSNKNLGQCKMCYETLLRRSEECIASTYEDSWAQQSDFERTEDSDSQGRWDTHIGEMWTSLQSEKPKLVYWLKTLQAKSQRQWYRTERSVKQRKRRKANGFPSLCRNEMKQMRSSSRYILETVISLIIVAKEVKGDKKVEILNAKETKDREKRGGTAVHTQTTVKKLSEIQR